MPPKNTRRDFQAELTDRVIESLETADPNGWVPPWIGSGSGLPKNRVTGHQYSGGNVILLQVFGGGQSEFATYRQWRQLDAQVRKGEKGNPVMFPCPVKVDKDDPDSETRTIFRWGHVFSAAQVEGYDPVTEALPDKARAQAEADAFIAASSATIEYGGSRACWKPATDVISIPDREAFHTTEGFYSVQFHELVHWTGHESRLKRDLETKFGSEKYAAEELVAEMGAFFLNAEFGMETETTQDTADYLANWLEILKADKTAIFTAAAKASQAVDYLARVATGVNSPGPA